MKTCLLAVALGAFLAGCGQKSDQNSATTNANSAGSSPLTAPVDYLDAVARAKQTAEKTVATVNLNEAIRMFNAERGRNPTNLYELVAEKYIPQIPRAPFGMKLVYDAKSGQVKTVKE